MENIWKPGSLEQLEIAKKFKRVFINQEKDNLEEVFSSKFNIHNGLNLATYSNYEFIEFNIKCEKFGLTNDANVQVFQPKEGYVYFSLGNADEAAIFESIFLWDDIEKKFIGNQYIGKIEPKIQFINHNGILKENRRINLKADIDIKNIIPKINSEQFNFNKVELDEILGGSFVNFSYVIEDDLLQSFWDKIKVSTENGIYTYDVLMRGRNHPLFIDNLYPIISTDKKSLFYPHKCQPVIINIILENGKEIYLKYPTDREWSFDSKIKFVCVTDGLSFDWIISYISN